MRIWRGYKCDGFFLDCEFGGIPFTNVTIDKIGSRKCISLYNAKRLCFVFNEDDGKEFLRAYIAIASEGLKDE